MNMQIKNYPIGPFTMMVIGSVVDGKPNFLAAGAGGCVCHKPMLEVSLNSGHCTTRGILETGYFSVNIPSVDLVKAVDYCGLVSARDADKSAVFTPFYCDEGSAPMASECALSYQCKVAQTVEINGFTVFFGDLLATFARNDCLTDGAPDIKRINPLLLMGMYYLSIGDIVGRAFDIGRLSETAAQGKN